jgi:hypothetical protein
LNDQKRLWSASAERSGDGALLLLSCAGSHRRSSLRVSVLECGSPEFVSKLESRSKEFQKAPSKHLRQKSKRAISKIWKPVFSLAACRTSFETVPYAALIAFPPTCLISSLDYPPNRG